VQPQPSCSRCGRGLAFNTRKRTVEACPIRCACCPNGERRPREIGVVKCSDSYEYQVRPGVSLTEERRAACAAEPPAHPVSAIGNAEVVGGISGAGKARRAEARVHRSITCAKILAVAAPAQSRDDRRLCACPANRAAKASTRYRHRLVGPPRGSTNHRRPIHRQQQSLLRSVIQCGGRLTLASSGQAKAGCAYSACPSCQTLEVNVARLVRLFHVTHTWNV